MKRVVLIVLDSFGVGALEDAERFGDAGADTFGHILDRVPDMALPNLRELGLGNIRDAAGGRMAVDAPVGVYGRARELSRGKDTITGHWEIAGIETMTPFKTYPEGFPTEIIEKFEKAIGRKIIGNKPASGTVIIEELGPEHEESGSPIVYTSADSVFQIAANVDVIPLEELYRYCKIAREMLTGEYACGRVIARPYVIKDGKRERTSDRKDFAVSPPEPTILDHIVAAGKQVVAVGKISDIFNGQGISRSVHTEDNMDGVDKTLEYMEEEFDGLIFTNLVDFDSKYGHRRDPEGYAKALMDFDERLPQIRQAMKEEDLLILCADHGNDPVHTGFDHTREHVPILAYREGIKPCRLEDRNTFADIGETVAQYLGVPGIGTGESFLSSITEG